jgi:hypothetical protein
MMIAGAFAFAAMLLPAGAWGLDARLALSRKPLSFPRTPMSHISANVIFCGRSAVNVRTVFKNLGGGR